MNDQRMKNQREMKRVEAVLASASYKMYMEKIAELESERRFCRHDRSHCWETARTAAVLFLLGEVPCPELCGYSEEQACELIYAAAFLHDIGRFREYEDAAKDHAVEGAMLARPLLEEAGFAEAETDLILSAIAHHRRKDNAGFDLLLSRADKESRPCYDCYALADCKKYRDGGKPKITV